MTDFCAIPPAVDRESYTCPLHSIRPSCRISAVRRMGYGAGGLVPRSACPISGGWSASIDGVLKQEQAAVIVARCDMRRTYVLKL